MAFSDFWNRVKAIFGIAAPKVGDALEAALRFLAPYAERFILDFAVKKLSSGMKKERVMERLRDRAASAGVRLPDSVLSFSIEGTYAALKADGRIPGKDYTGLLNALPAIQKAIRGGP